MQNLDFWGMYTTLQGLVGKKARVDDTYEGIIHAIFGGPIELFFMIATPDGVKFEALDNPKRIDIIE